MTLDPILLVDDEEDLRIALKESLKLEGFQVEDAPDALSALALMETRHYPVVLTDLNMPGGPTGFDLIKAVKARDPLTLCVVITGCASMEKAIQAVKFGAYDFVEKPFRIAEIQAVLERALSHAAALRQLEHYRKDLETRVLARVQDLKEFQEEVLKLNDLLMASQDESQEAPLLRPFLAHLTERFGPQGHAVLLPTLADGWELLLQQGPNPWNPVGLPPPSRSLAPLEWGGVEGASEGTFIPLRRGDRLLAGLFLEFPWRNAFNLEDRAFVFWRRQAEAALHGLLRTRAQVAQASHPHLP